LEDSLNNPASEGQPDNLPALIQMYEAAEEASYTARTKAERDRDYVDNKQLTDEEVNTLRTRGQPPIVLNVLRARASFLGGMEKRQRRDPKAWPRNNPNDVGAAEAFTDGMRYVIDKADYPSARSQAWKNIIVEGFAGLEIAALQKRNGDIEFHIKRIQWDRLFYDPHSSEPDFSDARYLGQVVWMDYEDALARAVANGMDEAQARTILEATIETAPGPGRTYDDKPRYTVWADGRRKRVRMVYIWHRTTRGWTYCEFTRGGKLYEATDPYVDQDGEGYCPWVIESANVDRDNNRYGEMRHLIDPQDEINKRRSKAQHLLNVTQVVAEKGAVDDVNQARRELARPDGWIETNVGAALKIDRGLDLSMGQTQMGMQAMAYIQEAGPNQALLGKGVSDQSGRAIEAQQAGGLVEQSDLMDTLRRMDWRVFNIVASMMKQFWTAEKWVRVTDDEDSPKWVGLNAQQWMDPQTGITGTQDEWRRAAEQGIRPGNLVPAVDPQTGQPMVANDMARLDMDIIVSDAPDTINQSGEHYGAFVELLGSNLPPPFLKIALEMHPGLPSKRKAQLLEMLDQAGQQPQDPNADDATRLAREMAEAKVAATRAGAYSQLASGAEKLARIGVAVDMPDMQAGMTDAPQAPPQGQPQGPGGVPMPQGMESAGGAPMGPDGGVPMPPQPQEAPMAGLMGGEPRMVA